jgi:hypothetical protein
MPVKQRRINHASTFAERLAAEGQRIRERAKKMPHGIQREELLRKARQMDTAYHMNEFAIVLRSAITEAVRPPQRMGQ